MSTHKRLFLPLILLMTIACALPPMVANQTPSAPPVATLGSPNDTPEPSETSVVPTKTTAAAGTDVPAATTAPTAEATSPFPSAVITIDNAAGLASSPLPLGGLMGTILWTSGNVLAEPLDPPPDILLFREAELHPIRVDPVGLAQPVPLPLNGGRVLAFAPDASSLVVQHDSGTAVVTPAGAQLWAVTEPAVPYGAFYSRAGDILALTSGDEWAVTLYNAETGAQTARLTGFETAAPIYSVYPAPGGNAVAWVARATLQLQDVATGTLAPPNSYTDFIGPMVFSPDGTRIFLAAAGNLEVVSVPDGTPAGTLALSLPLVALDVSPNNALLAGAYGASLQIWDAATLAPIAAYQTPAAMTSVSFSPDGRYITGTDDSGIFWVWKVP